MKTIIPFPKK